MCGERVIHSLCKALVKSSQSPSRPPQGEATVTFPSPSHRIPHRKKNHRKPVASPARPGTALSSRLWRPSIPKSPRSSRRLRRWRIVVVIVVLLVSHDRVQTILGRVSASIPKGERRQGEDLPDTGTGHACRPRCQQSDQGGSAQQRSIPPKFEGAGCRPCGERHGSALRYAGSTNAEWCSAA
jgi:hypothetical protein